MKVLSKYFKVALCFMAFALCSFMFAFTPTYTAVQAAEMAITSYNVAINALKMPTEEVNYEEGDEFLVPLLANSLGTSTPTGYTIRVIDPAGSKHDYIVGTSTADGFFGNSFVADSDDESRGLVENQTYLPINARNDGEYKVVYIVTDKVNDRTYYSNTYRVTVANVTHELDFVSPVVEEIADAEDGEAQYEVVGYTNSLIKTRLAVSSTEYELPLAYAKVAGKDVEINTQTGLVTNEVADVDVSFSPQDGTFDGDVFTTREDENGVTRYYITPTEAGTYTVEYSYSKSANRPTKSYTIIVEKNFEASAIKLASTPTMPSIELGKTVTLPKLTVNAGDQKNVDVNIESVKIEKEGSNGTVACVLEHNNLKFVMSPENFGVTNYEDMVGNYRITYTVKDANNKTLTETFKVDGVTASTKPTIKLSYNYDVEDGKVVGDVVYGAEVELQAQYSKDVEFVLPAVHVEDFVTTNYDDFTIIRTIRKGNTSGTYYFVDNVEYNESTGELDALPETSKYRNVSEDANIGDPTKAVKFKFSPDATNVEGTYYLEYRVISKVVKERESVLYANGTSEKYTFKVATSGATYNQDDLKVSITNLKDSSVKNTDKLTVKVSSSDETDIRRKNAVFTHGEATGTTLQDKTTFQDYLEYVANNLITYLGTNKTSHILDDERLITGWTDDKGTEDEGDDTFYPGLSTYFENVERLTENDTKDQFNLDLTGATGSVNVVAVTMNDGELFATDTKVLTIKDSSDAVSPTISIYASKLDSVWKQGGASNIKTDFEVGQGEKVTLPSVYVQDTDKTLSLNVMYYINSPENSNGAIQYLSPTNKNFYYDSNVVSGETVQVIDGGTITTSEFGTYYVAYTATDVAGNTSVMYFTFKVKDTSKPILFVEPVADDITINGNTITGPRGTVIDFETTLKSSNGELDYSNESEISLTIDDGGKGLDYQPSGNSKNSYIFNDYGTYVVTVSGTHDGLQADNKVIKVNIEKQEIKWLGEFDVTEYAKAGSTIKLPDIAASNDAVVKVTYLAPYETTDNAKEATKVTENGYSYWKFDTESTDKGSFKVIYTATTNEDVLTKELTIKVGDYQAPVLKYDAGKLTQKYVYDGTHDIEVVLKVNKSKKSFVVKVINNGKEVIEHDIGLVISDTDDTLTGGNTNMSWTNLEYDITGDSVTKGDVSTANNVTTTHYTISGPGSYSLKFTMKDSYDNVNDRESIDFKVVTKASVKENKDNVVGAVLIVISLVLLAGVILFFTFTGKKGGNKAKKNKTKSDVKATKVKAIKEEKTEVKEAETKEEVAELTEETQADEVVDEKVDDEPKSGDVE